MSIFKSIWLGFGVISAALLLTGVLLYGQDTALYLSDEDPSYLASLRDREDDYISKPLREAELSDLLSKWVSRDPRPFQWTPPDPVKTSPRLRRRCWTQG